MPRTPRTKEEMPDYNPNLSDNHTLHVTQETISLLAQSMLFFINHGDVPGFFQVLDDINAQVAFARVWAKQIPTVVPPKPKSKVDVMIDEAGRAEFERDMSELRNSH